MSLAKVARSNHKVAPELTTIGPVPKTVINSLPAPPNKVPALIVVLPLYVLAPDKVKPPVPTLIKPPVPEITPLKAVSDDVPEVNV